MVLNSRRLRRTTASFPMSDAVNEIYVQLTLGCELTGVLSFCCERFDDGKLFTVVKNVASVHDSKSHRFLKVMDREMLCCDVVQQSIPVARGSGTL